MPDLSDSVDEKQWGHDPLPSEAQLYLLFDKLNNTFFNGSLPWVKIIYSTRMLNAGSFSPGTKGIKIGVKYHKIFPSDLEDTLKHEMIHIIDRSHGKLFKSIAKRIGASLRAKSHPDLIKPAKYIYACPICGIIYNRRKRMRKASCGTCSKGGKYDPDCKLMLLKKRD